MQILILTIIKANRYYLRSGTGAAIPDDQENGSDDEQSVSGSGSCPSDTIQAILPQTDNFESRCRQVKNEPNEVETPENPPPSLNPVTTDLFITPATTITGVTIVTPSTSEDNNRTRRKYENLRSQPFTPIISLIFIFCHNLVADKYSNKVKIITKAKIRNNF